MAVRGLLVIVLRARWMADLECAIAPDFGGGTKQRQQFCKQIRTGYSTIQAFLAFTRARIIEMTFDRLSRLTFRLALPFWLTAGSNQWDQQ
jgi:hypothetical protein